MQNLSHEEEILSYFHEKIFSILIHSLAWKIEEDKGHMTHFNMKIQCEPWVKWNKRRREHMITCFSHSFNIFLEQYVSKAIISHKSYMGQTFWWNESLMKWRTHTSRSRQLVWPWTLMTRQLSSAKHPRVGIQLGNISISSSIEL